MTDFFRPSGTLFVQGDGPAMNRWAIFGRPAGTTVTGSRGSRALSGLATTLIYFTENNAKPKL